MSATGLTKVKLSKVGKLDGIYSWSLPAISTCPGAFKKGGELVDACRGCYATTGNYHRPNVKDAREYNKKDWKRKDWADDMVLELDNMRFFRWFDSGDVYHLSLAKKILEIMKRTPWISHWLPTRSHKKPSLALILDEMEKLPNVVVRRSSDAVDGSYDSTHGSTVIRTTTQETGSNVFNCLASLNEGKKCNYCRACWSKDVQVIAYTAHGNKMPKVYRELNLIAVAS